MARRDSNVRLSNRRWMITLNGLTDRCRSVGTGVDALSVLETQRAELRRHGTRGWYVHTYLPTLVVKKKHQDD